MKVKCIYCGNPHELAWIKNGDTHLIKWWCPKCNEINDMTRDDQPIVYVEEK